MKISLKVSKSSTMDVDTLNIFVWEDEIDKNLPDFPAEFLVYIRESVKKENFKGNVGEKLVLSTRGLISAYKLVILGLGKKESFDMNLLREQVANSIRQSQEFKAIRVAFKIDDWILAKLDSKIAVHVISEAIYLSTYRFLKYKSEDDKNKKREIEEIFINVNAGKISQAEQGIETAEAMSMAVFYARDLVNEAPQISTPSFLAQEAIKISKNSKGTVDVKIIEKDELEKLGMNAFLGVSRGSDEPPKFIILRYKAARPRKKVVIIGKGITFDTGGLSLKPPQHMETMKLDMAGAASIFGVFSEISYFKPAVELIGIIAACENMPSGKALKPGDILKAFNGKTIEVLNTDAEGRLTLADALSFAVKKEKPDEIIDMATLTGACMAALGADIAGLFGNNEKLLLSLEKSSKETGDAVWRMPLEEKYKELNKSHIADIKNIQTGKYGGAITAALFLEEFVGKTPWAHLDIAGPAFMEKDTPLSPYGGSGFGVRLILHYLNSL